MRRFYVAVLVSIMATAVPILKAHAGADVLVPSDTGGNSNSSGPNLGLLPSDSSEPQAAPATPPASTDYMPAPSYAPPSPSVSSNVPPGLTSAQAQAVDALRAQMEATRAQMQGQTPKVMVVKSPDMTQILRNEDNLPQSIDVSIGANKLTPFDAQLVSNQLGLSGAAAMASCHLSASGYIQATKTDKPAMSIFDLGTQNTGTARYDGKINQVITMVRALCDAQQLPPETKGVVVQVGDKYSASLGAARCQPPASGSPHKISIIIPESGPPQCRIS